MFVCKICNKSSNHKSGIAQHVIKTHKEDFLNYLMVHENYQIPKCSCGHECKRSNHLSNDKKRKNVVSFYKTCGEKECLKKLQRENRLKWMKENWEKTPWASREPSYPEKIFMKECKSRGYEKRFKIIPELPFFPYQIDFAFINEKVAVEIDGSQHLLAKERDNKKDKSLKKKGWRLIRFTATQIIHNTEKCFEKLEKFIGDESESNQVGIFDYENKKILRAKRLEEERRKNGGRTDLEIKRSLKQRKSNRPSIETLLSEVKLNGFTATGNKYGVSDNSIRKWIKTSSLIPEVRTPPGNRAG